MITADLLPLVRPSIMHGAVKTADRNLLFGILALQMDFIGRDALIKAMQAWVFDKEQALGHILVKQGALEPERSKLLETLVAEHLRQHDNDPQKSLAAVGSFNSARKQLEELADSEIQASLEQTCSLTPTVDRFSTTAPVSMSVGSGTANGTRYRVLRPHARGGLGEIFVAQDQELNREVALKEMQSRHADNATSRARFMLEAEVTGGLEHPGIVPVYGLGQYDDGRPFYAMRFIRGDSLKDAIEQFHKKHANNALPGARAVEFRKLLGRFVDVCNAVAYAHSRGVLHRDIKPANIMLGKFGETLVVDWGLAKAVDRPEVSTSTIDEKPLQPSTASGSADTQAGSAIGTPQFMSPEQANGRIDLIGPASDVYSLGATLYALLTGKPPFTETDVREVLRKVQKGDINRPRAVRGDVPPPLEAICLKAMALTPKDRYATPNALAEDVEHWLADEPVSAAPDNRLQRLARWGRRHRTLTRAAAVGLVLVTLISIGAVVLINEARAREEAQRAAAVQAKEGELEQRQRAQKGFRTSVEVLTRVYREIDDLEYKGGTIAQSLYETMNRSAEELETKVADDPELEPEYALISYWRGLDLKKKKGSQEVLPRFEATKRISEREAAAHPDVRRHAIYLARADLEIGNIHRDARRWDQATAEYAQAEKVLEKLVHDRPDSLNFKRYLAELYHSQAELLDSQLKFEESLARYRKAIALRQELFDKDPKHIGYRRDLARGHGYIGDVHAEVRDDASAQKAYAEADRLRAQLVAEQPGNPDFKLQLSRSYANTARLHRSRGRTAEALKAFAEPTRLTGELIRSHPDVLGFRADHAGNLNAVGALKLELAQLDGPAKACPLEMEEAAKLYEQLLAADPHAKSYRTGKGASLALLSKCKIDGSPRQATELLSEAHQQFEGLRSEELSGDELYTLAGVLALEAELLGAGPVSDRRRNEALATLRSAVARGDLAAERLERDRAFRSLKDRAEFQKIVQGLKAKG